MEPETSSNNSNGAVIREIGASLDAANNRIGELLRKLI